VLGADSTTLSLPPERVESADLSLSQSESTDDEQRA
jgi:hypothetical protein